MNTVTVIGAGFSGLTLAYELRRLGLNVHVLERSAHPGGLISTQTTEFGLVETAANALLSNSDIEALFADLQLPFAPRLRERKKRYIFWGRPRRWPISIWSSIRLVQFLIGRAFGFWRPRAGESVQQWAWRAVGRPVEERLLSPALQGIYAGDPAAMSATLVLSRLFSRRRMRRGRLRGSVAPRDGMGTLMTRLREELVAGGVRFEFGRPIVLLERPTSPVVICTSAWAAAEIVEGFAPELAARLAKCEALPLLSVTAFYKPSNRDRKGFGCLFPASQRFSALGVLFNDCIFAGRTSQRSETWIFGGAGGRELMKCTDEELLLKLAEDRKHLCGRHEAPLVTVVTRWPKALPHYSLEWERALQGLPVERPLFLHGNYLGSLGLSEIHQRSMELAQQIKDLYVS